MKGASNKEDIYYSGWISKQGQLWSSWKERYGVVEARGLLGTEHFICRLSYYLSMNTSATKPKGVIDLAGASLKRSINQTAISSDSDHFYLMIITAEEKKEYPLRFRTEGARNLWEQAIIGAIKFASRQKRELNRRETKISTQNGVQNDSVRRHNHHHRSGNPSAPNSTAPLHSATRLRHRRHFYQQQQQQQQQSSQQIGANDRLGDQDFVSALSRTTANNAQQLDVDSRRAEDTTTAVVDHSHVGNIDGDDDDSDDREYFSAVSRQPSSEFITEK